jgi:hypothetical protein
VLGQKSRHLKSGYPTLIGTSGCDGVELKRQSKKTTRNGASLTFAAENDQLGIQDGLVEVKFRVRIQNSDQDSATLAL